jgi:hypothetical protein
MSSALATLRDPPRVAHVLDVPVLAHPYRLPPLPRLRVLYHTATRVRVETPDGTRLLRAADRVIALADAAAWAAVQATYAAYQARLETLAATLRTLGTYARRLAAAGVDAPNPLCPTVLEIADPDGYYAPSLVLASPVPALRRTRILRHTAKMWQDSQGYGLRGQQDLFVCPDDTAWEQVRAAHAAAQAAALAWQTRLGRLGSYAAAPAPLAASVAPNGQMVLPW